MNSNHRKDRRRRPLWNCLVYVILICTIFGATTYSRYISQVTGTGSAMVARFAVDSNINENLTVAVPTEVNTSASTPIQISNMDAGGNVSDVALEYTIQIAFAGEVPFEFALVDTTADDMKMKGTRVTLKAGTGDAANLVIDSDTGSMPVADQTIHSYNLVVTWPATANDASFAGSVNAATVKAAIVQAEPAAG